jgi:hypothetical protein
LVVLAVVAEVVSLRTTVAVDSRLDEAFDFGVLRACEKVGFSIALANRLDCVSLESASAV